MGWICTLVLTYHPTRYHKKIVEFVLGGESYVAINNGGLSIADEISFFSNIQIYLIFPPSYG